mgnify:CR=1 FL=1
MTGMEKVKGIPYGKANFSDVVDQNYYYVDKTMYLPLMEQKASYIFMIRPRRFGKSVFISMMHAYYDMNQQDKFQSRFGDLWIGRHPTELRGKFQVLYFDFSRASSGIDNLEKRFDDYCSIQLDQFMHEYESSYDERISKAFYEAAESRSKLNILNTAARNAGIHLYLIIDEYDNFTNVVLSEKGKDTYKSLTHASGFYRDYFKLFKGMFDRIFLIGVSPITLDDLSSGYNIDWGISTEPEFNAMLGFSEAEVRTMFTYYQEAGLLKGSIDDMIEEMRPWYDNYCFARACLEDDKLFNCDMVLYYLQHRIAYNSAPEDMVDKNIRTDYKKLKMLVDIDRQNMGENRLSTIQEIVTTGEILVTLKTSFPADEMTFGDNFRSLLFYYGMLTISGTYRGQLRMSIPNNCVRTQYYTFLLKYFQTESAVDLSWFTRLLGNLAFDGEWKPFFDKLAEVYSINSSVRNLINGEHALQGFFRAFFSIADYYLMMPELEMNHGYSDILLIADRKKYPDIAHSYLLELKYAKQDASEAEVAKLRSDAVEQLERYSHDRLLAAACQGTQLHRLVIVFRGFEMQVCEEV